MISKKAMSGVITVVLLIALTMAATVLVWNVVNNLLTEKLEETSSCYDIFGKISINSRYTCYDKTKSEFHFSLSIGDIDVEEVLVGISGAGESKSYTLTKEGGDSGIRRTPSGEVKLPGKNAGFTYIVSSASEPDSIEVVPVINGKQCGISDSLNQIDDCALLVNFA